MLDFMWLDLLRNSASFIVALSILVTIHEYGHFWVARKNGVKVERFSIGFGRALWRKTGRDGTEYVLALIPLGGYVKMLDERVDNVAEEDKDKTFNSKSVYQRIAIVAAGPLANFIFALIAFYFMFLIGVPSVKPIIGDIVPHSIAAKAELSSGAQVVSVAGTTTRDWQDVNLALIGEIGQNTIEIKTKSKGSQYVETTLLNTKGWTYSPEKSSTLTSLGISPFRPHVYTELANVAEDSPAKKAGLLIGDRLLTVNGETIDNDWSSFADKIKQYPEQEIDLTIERSGLVIKVNVTPQGIKKGNETFGYIGIAPKVDKWPEEYLVDLTYGPLDSIKESAVRTWNMTELTFSMIIKFITGDVSVKNLSGPIGIAQGAGNSASYGFVYFLGFLALISINLGIINLLPLPVLDGGHLLYYVIELLTGKEVPERIQEVGFKFGALAIVTLMVIGVFNDFSRIF